MVSIGAGGFVAIACLVFGMWRIARWRSSGGGATKERVVAVLFMYLVAVSVVTFFPMSIHFYDWHGRFSFVPFASIMQLVQQTDRATALKNIAGNIVMFVPLGLLLPLLFRRLRSAGALAWRVALISIAIEVLQLPTRVRATDVDDVFLNVAGALIGYSVFLLLQRSAQRLPGLAALMNAAGSDTKGEPLLAAWLPVSVTIVLTLGLIVPQVLSGTLSESAIYEEAISGMTAGSVVARADSGNFVVLVAKSGEGASEVHQHAEFKRVLPGRYTKLGWSDPLRGADSRYSIRVTSHNPAAGESPVVYVVGQNEADALTVSLKTKTGRTVFEGPIDSYFAVVVPSSAGPEGLDLDAVFRTADGRDVTDIFGTY
ncbi:MAG: VanZ family protein [Clostridiales bacterium]|nr:VanZ family protein [Clostridiales bacterium]